MNARTDPTVMDEAGATAMLPTLPQEDLANPVGANSAGMESLDGARAGAADVPIIVLTGLDDRAAGVQAVQHGARDYLVKQHVSDDQLVRSLHYALARAASQKRVAIQREILEGLNSALVLDMDALGAVLRRAAESLGIERAGLRLRLGDEWPFHAALNLPAEYLEHVPNVYPAGFPLATSPDCPRSDPIRHK